MQCMSIPFRGIAKTLNLGPTNSHYEPLNKSVGTASCQNYCSFPLSLLCFTMHCHFCTSQIPGLSLTLGVSQGWGNAKVKTQHICSATCIAGPANRVGDGAVDINDCCIKLSFSQGSKLFLGPTRPVGRVV